MATNASSLASLGLAPLTGGASLAVGAGGSGGTDRHRRPLLMGQFSTANALP